MMAVRAGPGFELVVKLTVPLPLPLAPAVIVIQPSDETLVQPQPGAAVTAIAAPLPPAEATVCAGGLMPTAQDPACVTVTVCPATVTAPVRELPVLAGALSVTLPPPEPALAPENVTQLALLVDVHGQPAST